MRRSTTPTYVTSERREWKDFTCHSGLRITCQVSALSCSTRCSVRVTSPTQISTLNAMAAQYNDVITTILDGLVPVTKTTCMVRQSDPWYDNDCRSSKRAARKLGRQYKRAVRTAPGTSSTLSLKMAWIDALRAFHRLVEQKRRVFWRSKMSSATNQPRRCDSFRLLATIIQIQIPRQR